MHLPRIIQGLNQSPKSEKVLSRLVHVEMMHEMTEAHAALGAPLAVGQAHERLAHPELHLSEQEVHVSVETALFLRFAVVHLKDPIQKSNWHNPSLLVSVHSLGISPVQNNFKL